MSAPARFFLTSLLLVVAALGFVTVASAAEFTAENTTPFAIPDNQTTTSTVTVAGPGKITKVVANLENLDSDFAVSLDFLLESPSGKYVVLMSDSCGTGTLNNYDFVFDDAFSNLANSNEMSCDPVNQKPNNFDGGSADVWDSAPGAVPGPLLSHFNGDNATGAWTLHVEEDDAFGDTHSLEGWGLSITTDGPSFTRIPATGTGGAADETTVLTKNVASPARQITDVDVLINDFGHTFPDDIDMALQSPAGTSVMLLSDACGGDDQKDVDWRFDDEAQFSLPDSADPPCDTGTSGTWRPANFDSQEPFGVVGGPPGPYPTSLSAFDGQTAGGDWKLYIDDDVGGGYGYLVDFDLAITLKGAKQQTPSNPRIKYKKSRGSILATGRSTLTGESLNALECLGTVKSSFQRKVVRRKGKRKVTSWKTVKSSNSQLTLAGGKCGFNISTRLNKKYSGSSLRLVTTYLGGEYIAPFTRATSKKVSKLKF